MSVHLILFDCDGTLVDSRQSIVEAMSSAFRSCGLAPPEPSRIISTVGLSVPDAVYNLLSELDGQRIDEIGKAYKAAYFRLRSQPNFVEPFFEGAENALRKIGDQDHCVLGMATGKSQRGVRAVLDRLSVNIEKFVTIQTADNAPSKPHPAMIEQAMADTGIPPDRTIMIGDTSFDMEMARNAGVKSIGVTWGYHSQEEMIEAGALSIVSSFDRLLNEVLSMTGVGGDNYGN